MGHRGGRRVLGGRGRLAVSRGRVGCRSRVDQWVRLSFEAREAHRVALAVHRDSCACRGRCCDKVRISSARAVPQAKLPLPQRRCSAYRKPPRAVSRALPVTAEVGMEIVVLGKSCCCVRSFCIQHILSPSQRRQKRAA